MYKSVSLKDKNFADILYKNFTEDGVAVINDVFDDMECDIWIDKIIKKFELLDTGIDADNIEMTWQYFTTPPQTRDGLFQTLVSNFKEIYEVRAHKNVKKIFETIYSKLRGKKCTDFLCSIDGINIRPNLDSKNKKDWPHLDQTVKNDIFKCVQGQAVLTNTSASFVCSPKSHLIFDEILDKLKNEDNGKTNWLKLSDENIKVVKEMINKNKYEWQIPILSKKGSFIIWSSTLIHSARLQIRKELENKNDKYLGWRFVIYVCYRPKEEFSQKEIEKKKLYFKNNRTTTHWGNLFSKYPGGRYLYINKRHPNIENMLKEPKLVYDKIGEQILNDEEKKLLGF